MQTIVMKLPIILFVLVFLSNCNSSNNGASANQSSGTFKDARDGQTYPWVRLKDGKKWMAQNLNYETADSWCLNDEAENCKKYGRLYTWQAAQTVCPKGWQLPSNEDWWEMISFYKADDDHFEYYGWYTGEVAYQALRPGGESGFSAVLGGGRNQRGGFRSPEVYGHYWTSSEKNETRGWAYNFYNKDNERFKDREEEEYRINRVSRYDYRKGWAQSCRCIWE